MISTSIAMQDVEHCVGVHISFFLSPPMAKGFFATVRVLLTHLFPSWFLSPVEQASWQRVVSDYLINESGYLHLQATKPQTIAYALTDSPAGLAAYLVEKIRSWSDRTLQPTSTAASAGSIPDISQNWTKDELLDYIMLYWFGGAPSKYDGHAVVSSLRLYYESLHRPDLLQLGARVYVQQPTALMFFPFDFWMPPRAIAAYFYNIVKFTQWHEGQPQTKFRIRIFKLSLDIGSIATLPSC